MSQWDAYYADSMAPLFARAEREGLWFFCQYQQLWFNPVELRALQAEGRFRWGPGNWTLRDPRERLAELRQRADAAQQEAEAFAVRVLGEGARIPAEDAG